MSTLFAQSTGSRLASLYAKAHDELMQPAQQAPLRGFAAIAEQHVSWHNWMAPPFNRWGLRRLQQLRPTITIAKGQTTVASLPANAMDLDDFQFDSTCGLSIGLTEHLHASYTDGFLVMQGDDVLYEQYFNGQTADDRHLMFSVTKSLIGTLAEQLIHQRLLDPNRLAASYVEELSGSAFADATVRQLLDMAVGIEYVEKYDDPTSESSQYGYACGLRPAPEAYKHVDSLDQYLPSLRKRGEHGGIFHYVTATTEVLGWVMERACGVPCDKLLECIWSQLGCERDGYFLADSRGRSVAGAGFSATLRDMARFGRLLLREGWHDKKPLLPAEVVAAIMAGADPEIYAGNTDFAAWTPGASYRSQWYVFNDHSQAIMACGIHGQYLFIDFPSRTVIVKQSSLPDAVSDFDADSVRLLRALAAKLRTGR